MSPPPVLFYVVSIALLLINTNADHDSGGFVQFTYSGPQGPGNWGKLSPEYDACSSGKHQSPIDIVTEKVVLNQTLKPLLRQYGSTNATMHNSGLSIGMQYGKEAGVITVEGRNYSLKQMHWHSPSEHRLNGVQFDAELHIVHQAEDGSRAAVGILYRFGRADSLLARMHKKLAELSKQKSEHHQDVHVTVGTFDLKQVERVTRTRNYYKYYGSLTTPPCSENVIWHILGRVRSISKEQVDALRHPLEPGCRNNTRPMQELNGRVVQLFNNVNNF
ncbi:alpha carbonic anhydrase 1, chloroplastic [Cornus florida]|uniref:alpha carbonic anhydrase 1, chloroplastic n=1 Tax=Cornus florida TaxID=4283 RepID=UPI00289DDCB5|nr:alpha carbonic anhydrase 1, chloroplastic [Cornus florida]